MELQIFPPAAGKKGEKGMQATKWLALLYAVRRLQHAVRGIVLEGAHVNKSQLFTMMTLRYKGIRELPPPEEIDPYEPMTLSGLAREMGQTTPALSQRITQLEEMGYVRRSPDSRDRRTVWIQLTPEGFAVMRQAGENFSKRMEEISGALGEETIARMTADFDRISDALETAFAPGQARR